MTQKMNIQLAAFGLMFVFAFFATSNFASAHNGVDHSASASVTASDPELAGLQQLITALSQLVDLLKQKAELSGHAVAVADHHHHDDTGEQDTLKIWIEVHSYMPHAHVQRPGEDLDEFFLDGVSYTDHEAMIKAIADKTEFTETQIRDIITFPEGDLDAKGDSVDADEDEAESEDVSGIHIMGDGTIMWGDGDEVAGATITADGKVQLSDGRIIEPKFDLR